MVRRSTTDRCAGHARHILELGLHAPRPASARGGLHRAGGADQTAATGTPPSVERREGFPWPRCWPRRRLIIPLRHAQTYVDRYAEADKASPDWATRPMTGRLPYGSSTRHELDADAAGAGRRRLGALFFGISTTRTPSCGSSGARGLPADRHHRRRLPGDDGQTRSSGRVGLARAAPARRGRPPRWLVTGPGHDPEPHDHHSARTCSAPSADPAISITPKSSCPTAYSARNDRLALGGAALQCCDDCSGMSGALAPSNGWICK